MMIFHQEFRSVACTWLEKCILVDTNSHCWQKAFHINMLNHLNSLYSIGTISTILKQARRSTNVQLVNQSIPEYEQVLQILR